MPVPFFVDETAPKLRRTGATAGGVWTEASERIVFVHEAGPPAALKTDSIIVANGFHSGVRDGVLRGFAFAVAYQAMFMRSPFRFTVSSHAMPVTDGMYM